MKRYNLINEEWLWEAYKETVPREQTIDEPLRETMAERIVNRHDDPAIVERAEQFLEDD